MFLLGKILLKSWFVLFVLGGLAACQSTLDIEYQSRQISSEKTITNHSHRVRLFGNKLSFRVLADEHPEVDNSGDDLSFEIPLPDAPPMVCYASAQQSFLGSNLSAVFSDYVREYAIPLNPPRINIKVEGGNPLITLTARYKDLELSGRHTFKYGVLRAASHTVSCVKKSGKSDRDFSKVMNLMASSIRSKSPRGLSDRKVYTIRMKKRVIGVLERRLFNKGGYTSIESVESRFVSQGVRRIKTEDFFRQITLNKIGKGIENHDMAYRNGRLLYNLTLKETSGNFAEQEGRRGRGAVFKSLRTKGKKLVDIVNLVETRPRLRKKKIYGYDASKRKSPFMPVTLTQENSKYVKASYRGGATRYYTDQDNQVTKIVEFNKASTPVVYLLKPSK